MRFGIGGYPKLVELHPSRRESNPDAPDAMRYYMESVGRGRLLSMGYVRFRILASVIPGLYTPCLRAFTVPASDAPALIELFDKAISFVPKLSYTVTPTDKK